jgi:hypothetical protein
MRNVSDKRRENQTHFLYKIILFSENRAVYEIMWKNMVVRQAAEDNIIWRMRFVCWIIKAAHILRICNTYVIQWLRERALILRYTYIYCLVLYCTNILIDLTFLLFPTEIIPL